MELGGGTPSCWNSTSQQHKKLSFHAFFSLYRNGFKDNKGPETPVTMWSAACGGDQRFLYNDWPGHFLGQMPATFMHRPFSHHHSISYRQTRRMPHIL